MVILLKRLLSRFIVSMIRCFFWIGMLLVFVFIVVLKIRGEISVRFVGIC